MAGRRARVKARVADEAPRPWAELHPRRDVHRSRGVAARQIRVARQIQAVRRGRRDPPHHPSVYASDASGVARRGIVPALQVHQESAGIHQGRQRDGDRRSVCPAEYQHPAPDFRFQVREEAKQGLCKPDGAQSAASPCGAQVEQAAPVESQPGQPVLLIQQKWKEWLPAQAVPPPPPQAEQQPLGAQRARASRPRALRQREEPSPGPLEPLELELLSAWRAPSQRALPQRPASLQHPLLGPRAASPPPCPEEAQPRLQDESPQCLPAPLPRLPPSAALKQSPEREAS